jgi:hypothetical protein
MGEHIELMIGDHLLVGSKSSQFQAPMITKQLIDTVVRGPLD